MEVAKVTVCDQVVGVDEKKTCRRLADLPCQMCSGDFCNAHINSQSLTVHLDRIQMIQGQNPNEAPKANHTTLASDVIYICERCFVLINQSQSGRNREDFAVHWNQINATIKAATEEMRESLKALWAQRALTKGGGDAQS